MSMRVRRVVLLLVVLMSAGCTDDAPKPAAHEASRAGASTTDPTALVGAWHVEAAGEDPRAVLLLGDGVIVFRRCGTNSGAWDAASWGGFTAHLHSADPTCVNAKAPWLEGAVAFRVDGEVRELLGAGGAVLARLAPGARPTAPPNMLASHASPPAVDAGLRSRLADPAPLPAGVTAVAGAQVAGRWVPAGERGRNPAAYVVLGPDHAWGGSDGCNAEGGSYVLGPGGALVVTAGWSTAMGCNNSGAPGWVTHARRLGLQDGLLVLVDAKGRVLGRMRRA